MTVNYMHKVGSVGRFSGFTSQVLLRWHGGLFQAVLGQLYLYIVAYVLLALFYVFILKEYESLAYHRW